MSPVFARILIAIVLIGTSSLGASAKLNNSVAQNLSQYGNEILKEVFPSKGSGFTGYIHYSIDSKWKLVAYFRNGVCRSEHLIPKNYDDKNATLNRSEVRIWAGRMFDFGHRGQYRKKMTQYRSEGHFFDKGLIAYEYHIVKKKTNGFKGVKVLLYENNQSFWQLKSLKAYF